MRSWTDDDLRVAVASNATMAGTLRQLNLSRSPGNYKALYDRIRMLGIDRDHFTGKSHGTAIRPNKKLLSELLVVDGTETSSKLRVKLLKAGLLREECYECGMGPVWQGKPITLQLDHINGTPSDNRLENLRILCPNCHTQTKNFTGKNISSRFRKVPKRCTDCHKIVDRVSTRCVACAGKQVSIKTKWPSPEEVAEEVVRTSYVAVAARIGVSDAAVKKYLRRMLGFAPKKHSVSHGGSVPRTK